MNYTVGQRINEGGYTFEILKPDKNYDYRVRCIEKNEVKGSIISYKDAIGMLISSYNFRLGKSPEDKL